MTTGWRRKASVLLLLLPNIPMSYSSKTCDGDSQGDRMGQFFGLGTFVYFGHFFEYVTNFFVSKNVEHCVHDFDEKMCWAIFWAQIIWSPCATSQEKDSATYVLLFCRHPNYRHKNVEIIFFLAVVKCRERLTRPSTFVTNTALSL
jgi:hypothetical protein